MVYRRARGNIRRPRKPAARPARRRRVVTRRRRYTKSPCVCPKEMSPGAKFALAQLDPFVHAAIGAKVPDSNTMPSISNVDSDLVSIVVGTAESFGAIAFTPSYFQAHIQALNTTGTLSWPQGNFRSRRNYTQVAATLEAIRPVAHAIRISSSLAPTAATGFVHIGLSVESRINDSTDNTIMSYPTTVNEMTGLAHYKRVTLASLTQSPITVINKWIDELAFRYDDPRTRYSTGVQGSATNAGYNTLSFQQSWAAIVIMVEGVPANSTPISVEHILHTEAIAKKDALIIGTPAAANSPGIMSSVSSMSGQTDFSHTEAAQDSYFQQGLQVLASAASEAGNQVFNNVAMPLLARATRGFTGVAMNMAANAIAGRGGIPGVNANPRRLEL